MSTDQSRRDRGGLFENTQKRKPSQPDLQGECTLGGVVHEIRAWHREDQLAVTIVRQRGNSAQDAFRGALDRVPGGGKGKDAGPAWAGEVVGDDGAYAISAFEKQGKSGTYYQLTFEPIDRPRAPLPDVLFELAED